MSSNLLLYEDYAHNVYQDDNIVPVDDSLPSNSIFIQYRFKRTILNYCVSEENGELLFEPLSDFECLPDPMKVKSYAVARHLLSPNHAWINISSMLSKIGIPLFFQLRIIHVLNQKVDYAASVEVCDPIGIIVNILHVKYEPYYDDDIDEEGIVARVVSMSLADRADDHFVPASNLSIESLKKLKLEGSDENCPICLEEFLKGGAEVTSMPCLHFFHGDCIVQWLETSHRCPLCRFELPTASS